MAEHEDLRKRKDFAKHEDAKEHLVDSHTEPSGVEPQPVLPRDIFSNKFTLFLHLLIRKPLFQVFSVLFAIFLFFAMVTDSDFWTTLWIILSVVTGVLLLVFLLTAADHSLTDVSKVFRLEQSMQFICEIKRIKPGMRMPKWDIVASRMNDYLFETGIFPNKYTFYDGRHCCNVFQKVYWLPREEAFDATPLDDFVHSGNSAYDFFRRQVSRDVYESIDKQVKKIYEESLESCGAEV